LQRLIARRSDADGGIVKWVSKASEKVSRRGSSKASTFRLLTWVNSCYLALVDADGGWMAKSREPHLLRWAQEFLSAHRIQLKALAREMRSAVILDSVFVWEQIRQELELVTSSILMSASTDQPERMAEILREIITLWGRKGADVRTELANATENTHRSENSALEVRNQKSGLEIIPRVKHWPNRFSARASPENNTQTRLAIASRNIAPRKWSNRLG
jgi:hypothetical protein